MNLVIQVLEDRIAVQYYLHETSALNNIILSKVLRFNSLFSAMNVISYYSD